jgi:hypothetical protein
MSQSSVPWRDLVHMEVTFQEHKMRGISWLKLICIHPVGSSDTDKRMFGRRVDEHKLSTFIIMFRITTHEHMSTWESSRLGPSNIPTRHLALQYSQRPQVRTEHTAYSWVYSMFCPVLIGRWNPHTHLVYNIHVLWANTRKLRGTQQEILYHAIINTFYAMLIYYPSRMTGKFKAVNTHSHKYCPIRPKIP